MLFCSNFVLPQLIILPLSLLCKLYRHHVLVFSLMFSPQVLGTKLVRCHPWLRHRELAKEP